MHSINKEESMKFACLLANGFEETEAITVIDCLRRAGVEVDCVSIHELEVTGSHQITVKADKLFGDMDHYDGVFLPGGQPGSTHLGNDERVLNLVRDYVHQDKWVSAICAAPTVLAKAGIIKNKDITSYPTSNVNGMFDEANYKDDLVVVDGKMVTSRSMGTALHLGIKLVEVLGLEHKKLASSILFQGE